MFLLNGLMKHYLLEIINVVPIDDLYFFSVQYGGGRTFIFSGIDIEIFYLISLTVELIKMFLFESLINFYVLLWVPITPNSLNKVVV